MKSLFGAALALAWGAISGSAWAQEARNASATSAPSALAPVAATPSVRSVPQSPVTLSLGAPQGEPPVVERHWYGWQTLAGDATSVGLFVAALTVGDGRLEDGPGEVIGLMSAAVYLGAAPALHVVHRRGRQALGSFALRAALPVVGGLVGLSSATCPPPNGEYGNCGLGEFVVGTGLGAVAAVLLDASLLGWEDVKPDEVARTHWGLAPALSGDGKRGELRVFGTF